MRVVTYYTLSTLGADKGLVTSVALSLSSATHAFFSPTRVFLRLFLAGADSKLELAFTLADGLEYCRTGLFLGPLLYPPQHPTPSVKRITLCGP